MLGRRAGLGSHWHAAAVPIDRRTDMAAWVAVSQVLQPSCPPDLQRAPAWQSTRAGAVEEKKRSATSSAARQLHSP